MAIDRETFGELKKILDETIRQDEKVLFSTIFPNTSVNPFEDEPKLGDMVESLFTAGIVAVAVTEGRVIIAKKSLTSQCSRQFIAWSRIENVEIVKKFGITGLKIVQKDEKVTILRATWGDGAVEVKNLHDALRDRLEERASTADSAAPDATEWIVCLAQMRQAGYLTAEEFTVLKDRILAGE